jgi:hypothetical protein
MTALTVGDLKGMTMAEKRLLIIDGIRYKVFDKSIIVEGIAEPIYYGREVIDEDAFILGRIASLGAVRERTKVAEVLRGLMEG